MAGWPETPMDKHSSRWRVGNALGALSAGSVSLKRTSVCRGWLLIRQGLVGYASHGGPSLWLLKLTFNAWLVETSRASYSHRRGVDMT